MALRDVFWFGAGLLTALAALFVILPLVRGTAAAGTPGRARLGVALAVVAGACALVIGLYLRVGAPGAAAPGGGTTAGTAMAPAAAPAASSMEAAAARLAERLATQGGTPEDWELLAQSYDFLGRPGDAAAARRAGGAQGAGTGSDSGPATAGTARIEGTVELAPALAARAAAGATLYVYAREPGAAGPPLAVLRLTTGAWPARFALDDTNAMVPGRNLSGAARVQLEARISASGNATPQPGDLAGSVADVDPRAGAPVRVTIDRVIG